MGLLFGRIYRRMLVFFSGGCLLSQYSLFVSIPLHSVPVLQSHYYCKTWNQPSFWLCRPMLTLVYMFDRCKRKVCVWLVSRFGVFIASPRTVNRTSEDCCWTSNMFGVWISDTMYRTSNANFKQIFGKNLETFKCIFLDLAVGRRSRDSWRFYLIFR